MNDVVTYEVGKMMVYKHELHYLAARHGAFLVQVIIVIGLPTSKMITEIIFSCWCL